MSAPLADAVETTPARQPVSEARLAANRANAQKSTGPKTAEGKARSRQNALKHGMAGAGVCLPTEDAAQVEEHRRQLHEEMAPSTLRAAMLVETIALSYTRMRRAARHEAAVLAHKQRHAIAAFDDARLAQAEHDVEHLSLETATRYRHLIATPEGVDLLILRLGDVRDEIRNPHIRWNYVHGTCLERFCGRNYHDRFTRSRGRALSLALEFDPSELTDDDRVAIDAEFGGRIRDWARPQMEAFIDAEIARLEEIRATLDLDAIDRDRLEAADRALFDTSREAALARRYEAAATRTFFRALKEYDRAQALAAADPDDGPSALDDPSPTTAEVCEEGDGLDIKDPADAAEQPAPPRRSYERPPLALYDFLRVVQAA